MASARTSPSRVRTEEADRGVRQGAGARSRLPPSASTKPGPTPTSIAAAAFWAAARTRRPRRFSPRRWRAIPGTEKRIDDAWVDSYIGRGLSLIGKRKDGEAAAVFAKALARDPAVSAESWVEATSAVAQAHQRAQGQGGHGGLAKALAAIPRAKRIDKTWAEGFDTRAWNKFVEGKASEGLSDAEKAVALAPGGGSMLDTRAQIYLALDRVDGALADFDAAIAAGFNTFGGTYYGRGRCHEIKGKAALAVADYSRASNWSRAPLIPVTSKRPFWSRRQNVSWN